jgi:hypothetical protein
MMKSLSAVALLLASLIPTALADETAFFDADRAALPKAFQGNWCIVNTGNETTPITYRRGQCSAELRMRVLVDEINTYDNRCKVLIVASIPKYHNYLVKFWCEYRNGDKPEVVNFWTGIDAKGHLTLEKMEREP